MGQHVAFFGFQLWKNGIFAIILGWWVSFYFVVLFYKVKEQMFLHFRSEHGDRFPWGQPIWSDEASLVTWLQNTYQITVHSVSKGFWFLSRNIFICSTFQCFHYTFSANVCMSSTSLSKRLDSLRVHQTLTKDNKDTFKLTRWHSKKIRSSREKKSTFKESALRSFSCLRARVISNQNLTHGRLCSHSVPLLGSNFRKWSTAML